jgi:hypothetical protein
MEDGADWLPLRADVILIAQSNLMLEKKRESERKRDMHISREYNTIQFYRIEMSRT